MGTVHSKVKARDKGFKQKSPSSKLAVRLVRQLDPNSALVAGRTCQPSAVALQGRHADSGAVLAAEAVKDCPTAGMTKRNLAEAATQ